MSCGTAEASTAPNIIDAHAPVPALDVLAAGGSQGGIQPEVACTLSDAELQRLTAPGREVGLVAIRL